VFIILFYYYGYIVIYFKNLVSWQSQFLTNCSSQTIAIIIIVILILFLRYLRKTKRNLINLTVILNVFVISLFVIPISKVLYYETNRFTLVRNINDAEHVTNKSQQNESLPDIYYIILDQYSRDDTLRNIYNYDNSYFIEYLKKKSFYIASNSHSNYLKTGHSLASTLNLKYINYLSNGSQKSDDYIPIYNMLNNYEVQKFLRNIGYKYIHMGSWWWPTSKNRNAHININKNSFLPEFASVLFRQTMLDSFFTDTKVNDRYTKFRFNQWRRVLYKFEKLAKIHEIQEPTFTFAHFLIPHNPYVFEPNGDFVEKEMRYEKNDERFINQIIYLNKKLMEIIEIIQTKSKEQPIIILQADEGSFPKRYRGKAEDSFDWRYATNSELQEKMRILNAYYFPNVENDKLYSHVTPVNSFRILFNLYFNTNYPLLDDKAYAFINSHKLYDFFEVTDIVR